MTLNFLQTPEKHPVVILIHLHILIQHFRGATHGQAGYLSRPNSLIILMCNIALRPGWYVLTFWPTSPYLT